MEAPLAQGQAEANAAAEDAHSLHSASVLQRTLKRLPALLATFGIELVVGFVFSKYQDTFKKYPLLISFQPILSAISGNFGLQASTTITRALAVGLIKAGQHKKAMIREFLTGILSGVAMGAVAAVTAFVWYSPWFTPTSGHHWAGALVFALAISSGQVVSIMTAAVTGSAAPFISKHFGCDPAATAGPFETAFQDVIGGTFLLAASASILGAWGDQVGECPGDSIGGCLATCRLEGNATDALFSIACIQQCLKLADAGIC